MNNVNSTGKVQSFGDLAYVRKAVARNRGEIKKLIKDAQDFSIRTGWLSGIDIKTRRGIQSVLCRDGKVVSNIIKPNPQKVNIFA